MTEPKAKQDPKTSSTKGAKAPKEKDPAKQTPSGQDRRDDQPKNTKTADSKAKDSKTSVQVSLDGVELNILDSLRQATTRNAYVQAIVSRHIAAASPYPVVHEDDDLPGNEREVKRPSFRV